MAWWHVLDRRMSIISLEYTIVTLADVKVVVNLLSHLKKTTGYFIAETAKGYIRAPFITRKRPVPRGNTAPFRSIRWVTDPAPFPTSERGRDSQRDR